jgi:uncharacterized iron-regulated protein
MVLSEPQHNSRQHTCAGHVHTYSAFVCVFVQAYFDHHATVIQKHWRGHYSRAQIHDFYARKAFLQSVAAANAAVREEMEAELQATLEHKQQEAQAAAKQHFDTQVCGHKSDLARMIGC